MSAADILAPPDADAVTRAIDAYSSAVKARYGQHLTALYLFGSRARGDFRPYSDVDLALILTNEDWRSFRETKALSDLAYDVLLDTGVEIQPWPIDKHDWANPPAAGEGALVRAIRRDGRAIWVSS